MKVYCPKCKSEVKLPEKSDFVFGKTVSKEMRGSYALPLENNTGLNKKENEKMNMNEFDIDVLAKMVAAQLNANANAQNNGVKAPESNYSRSKVNTDNLKDSKMIDRNHWAENSKFYGKTICGYAYNPYMIRRFLPAQFNNLMREYRYNVHKGITKEYPYMYTIKFTLEEVRKLAMLKKRDVIAFDERKLIFTIQACKNIFIKYLNDVEATLWSDARWFARRNKIGAKYNTGIKGYGYVCCGTVVEKIINHNVAKVLEPSDEFTKIMNDISELKKKVENTNLYAELYKLMADKPLINVPEDAKKSKDFMNCFIKAGAYYTLKQDLMFNESICFKGLYGRAAVDKLRYLLIRGTEGYIFYAMLKEVRGIK